MPGRATLCLDSKNGWSKLSWLEPFPGEQLCLDSKNGWSKLALPVAYVAGTLCLDSKNGWSKLGGCKSLLMQALRFHQS